MNGWLCAKLLEFLSFASHFTQPARLPRDVPEKAEAFQRAPLLPASDELPSFVAMITWLAAPDQRKASFFQTHHGAGMDGWRVVAYYENSSALRNKYAGDLPLSL